MRARTPRRVGARRFERLAAALDWVRDELAAIGRDPGTRDALAVALALARGPERGLEDALDQYGRALWHLEWRHTEDKRVHGPFKRTVVRRPKAKEGRSDEGERLEMLVAMYAILGRCYRPTLTKVLESLSRHGFEVGAPDHATALGKCAPIVLKAVRSPVPRDN